MSWGDGEAKNCLIPPTPPPWKIPPSPPVDCPTPYCYLENPCIFTSVLSWSCKLYTWRFFGEDFVDLLLKETNTSGDNKIQAKGTIPKSSCFHKGYHTNQEELLAFLAVVLNMKLIRKNSYQNQEDWSQSIYTVFSGNIY